jgi:4-hydroxy-tetrahydrodipicolinate reductase
MKIALLGYGRMGKEIEKIAHDRGHETGLIIDIDNQHELTAENLKKTDVAIDFSIPTSAYKNIIACFEAGLPIVSGTTGWIDKYDEVNAMCKEKNGTFFYASNYSVGVNIFFHINKKLAEVMEKFEQYSPGLEETHHTQKLDAPSGTAITLANDLTGTLSRKEKWELDQGQEIGEKSLGIKAHRIENVPGIHVINYDSPVDFIEIKHSAKNRQGFAMGAVLAAEFIKDRKGVFGMKDIFGF